jgi:hypothetical protein
LLHRKQKLVQLWQLPQPPQLLSLLLLLLLQFFILLAARRREVEKPNRLKLLQPANLPQKMNDLVIPMLRLKKTQKKLGL